MPAWLIPAITAAGSLFSGAAKNSADQRASENNQVAQRNSLLAQLHAIRQGATMQGLQGKSNEQMAHANLDLDRRQHALNAPDTRMSQSVRGSILKNAQPFTLSGLPDRIASRIPQMSGGLTPAMFSDDTRALGEEMTRKALIDQLRGDEFAPMEKTDFTGGVLQAPQMENFQKSGLLEKILGGLGLGASLIGGIGSAVQGSRRVPTDMNNAMPSPYTGKDRYGNAANFRLPRVNLLDLNMDEEV